MKVSVAEVEKMFGGIHHVWDRKADAFDIGWDSGDGAEVDASSARKEGEVGEEIEGCGRGLVDRADDNHVLLNGEFANAVHNLVCRCRIESASLISSASHLTQGERMLTGSSRNRIFGLVTNWLAMETLLF